MKFISEITIDKIIDELEEKGITEPLIQSFKDSQPLIYAYLFSDSFDLSTQNEKEYLFYLVIVAWKSIMEVVPDLEIVDEEEIGVSEEKNWELKEGEI